MKLQYLIFIISVVLFQQPANAAEYEAKLSLADIRQLSLPVSGIVETINVAAGAFVKAGEKMLSLDCGLYRAKLKQSLALATGLEPGVETARKEKELADELFARTVLSEIEHRQAELVYIEKKSKHSAAVAHSEELKWQVKNCDLLADTDLMVLDVHVNKGQLFNLKADKSLLLTVASQKNMQLTAKLALPLVHPIKINQTVKASVAGRLLEGKIISVLFRSDDTAIVTASIDLFDPLLISAKSARLIIKH
ncbi:MAG: biotin/lipoyl-binding protein [Gammaproteobacteria bacterium]|nr:biotin/lipoyl-binding protein [Gammaproteobacteria bacterium]